MIDRVEHDLIGEFPVPGSAYYGVHTARALRNFPISGVAVGSWQDMVVALAQVKQAAARANRELGLLSPTKAEAIAKACDDIRGGWGHDQFVVDAIQGGAGTSTNMNANEVIANRALELLGNDLGEYEHLHPLEDVNLGQSTNDVYPTALRLAVHSTMQRLLAAVRELKRAFAAKGAEFASVVKLGRTQLQDAVPMTLGQEFDAFASITESGATQLESAAAQLTEVNLGGTAIGTGLNAHADFSELACRHLGAISGVPVAPAADLVAATPDVGCFVQVSGALKRLAVNVSKICNDLRLLSSGPRAGLAEIKLPAVQAGSSIMPGKVNPVVPEVVNQVAFRIIGHDATVTAAAESGQLQLNAFEPIIAHSLFSGANELSAACGVLSSRCVSGITTDAAALRSTVDNSVSVVTALNREIGYRQATTVAQEALASGRGVADLVIERGMLSSAQVARLLDPVRLTGTHHEAARET